MSGASKEKVPGTGKGKDKLPSVRNKKKKKQIHASVNLCFKFHYHTVKVLFPLVTLAVFLSDLRPDAKVS